MEANTQTAFKLINVESNYEVAYINKIPYEERQQVWQEARMLIESMSFIGDLEEDEASICGRRESRSIVPGI